MSSSTTWAYFDGNAITQLWDWYTEVKVEGRTGDPRDATPFADTVLSDFVLDEIITNPITDAYKKHLLLLMIYPDIPILRALESMDLSEAQRSREVLLRPPEYLKNAIGSRTLALVGHQEGLDALASDMANKQARIDQDAVRSSQYVTKDQRVSFDAAVMHAVSIGNLQPGASARDFFDLCMTLYSYEVHRYIDRPSSERKGGRRLLNQQIDFYHLSYLPFVEVFITNDTVLGRAAADLIRIYCLPVEVETAETYLSKWIRRQLMR